MPEYPPLPKLTAGIGHDQEPNEREAHRQLFSMTVHYNLSSIEYAGETVIVIEADTRWPAGFHERLVRHIMDLLTGATTALWDEQAVWGVAPRDMARVREAALAHADMQAATRECDHPEPDREHFVRCNSCGEVV